MPARLYTFAGGAAGSWRVLSSRAVRGEPLATVPRVAVVAGDRVVDCAWRLRGITSHERYVTREEKSALGALQPALGRVEASHAALIPIRKSAAWWALPQDERREIFEARSAHVATGMKYLPAIARRLHHCRDLAEDEPFDFITWFEYAPADAASFDALVAALRLTPEWEFVDREVDIRLARDVS